MSFNSNLYISLHNHTQTGSVGDATLSIRQLIDFTKQQGLTAAALTEHGSMSTMYRFYAECKRNNIEPIIGCEVYESNNQQFKAKTGVGKNYFHLVLLATKNAVPALLSLVNDAAIHGVYYKPRTDLRALEQYGAGLIALSGCAGGRIPQLILRGELAAAKWWICKYRDIFQEFYLELQPGDFPEQRLINDRLQQFSLELDVPLIATNDVHYAKAEDWEFHDLHVKDIRGLTACSPPVYPAQDYYLMTGEEMKVKLAAAGVAHWAIKKAMANTIHVARACSGVQLNTRPRLPHISNDAHMSLQGFCQRQLAARGYAGNYEYEQRLADELAVIQSLGFASYFLIVADYVGWAKEQQISVGPARGSAAGSLVAFLSGITQVDPLLYNLPFERFLSVHRKSLPDVDVDFDHKGQERVFQYVVDKYGTTNCARVGSLHYRKAKAAIRAAGSMLGLEPSLISEIAKQIPLRFYGDEGDGQTEMSLTAALAVSKELAAYQGQYSELFRIAAGIENLPTTPSMHPAGLIIAPTDLSAEIPLVLSKNKEDPLSVAALNKEDLELSGMIKFDLLAVEALSVIDQTFAAAGIAFDYATNTYDDPDVWDLIGSANTTGLFQIGSAIYKKRMDRLHPRSIPELAACLALLRTPCINSGMDEVYMQILNGEQAIELIHPVYDGVTAATNGLLLYQEQLMYLATAFGLSLEDGYALMKAVAQKKPDKIAALQSRFKAKQAGLNMDDAVFDRVWQIVLSMGQYSFSLNHAVAYAHITYASALAKTKAPLIYMANLITNSYDRAATKMETELRDAIKECARLGIGFLPIRANASHWEFTVEDRYLRMGLCSIKGFGAKASEELLMKRPFDSIADAAARLDKRSCGVTAIRPLIFAGAFANLCEDDQEAFGEFMLAREKKAPAKLTSLKIGSEVLDLVKDNPAKRYKKILSAAYPAA